MDGVTEGGQRDCQTGKDRESQRKGQRTGEAKGERGASSMGVGGCGCSPICRSGIREFLGTHSLVLCSGMSMFSFPLPTLVCGVGP